MGKLLQVKLWIWRYLKKWCDGKPKLSDSCAKVAKTLSMYKSLKVFIPKVNQVTRVLSTREGVKIWFAAIGAWEDRSCRPKLRVFIVHDNKCIMEIGEYPKQRSIRSEDAIIALKNKN